MSSWLVNTTGLPNRWLPTDLYQEHNNLLIKTIYGAKHGVNWDVLRDLVSTNIETFSKISKKLAVEFAVPYNGISHSTVSRKEDIGDILVALNEANIFSSLPGTVTDVELVTDLIEQGSINLHNGRIDAFIRKHSRGMGDDDEDIAVNERLHMDEMDIHDLEKYME
ncbi:hypothetical protein BGX20_007403, partial [Mortierella sp. AD010]